MYQFFVDDAQVHKHEIVIEGSDVNHIRNVLRMKIDERIRISNMSGKAYFCHITLITEDMGVAEIDSEDDNCMCLERHEYKILLVMLLKRELKEE